MAGFRALLIGERKLWTLAGAGLAIGMVLGFAVPLATAYQPIASISPPVAPVFSDPSVSFVEVLVKPDAAPEVASKDQEMLKLEARNRRLEVLLSTMRKRKAARSR